MKEELHNTLQQIFLDSKKAVRRIGFQRNKALIELDKYLINVESELLKKSIPVFWAKNDAEKEKLISYILDNSQKDKVITAENIQEQKNAILYLQADYLVSEDASFIFFNQENNINSLYALSDEIIIEIAVDKLISGFERINELIYTLDLLRKTPITSIQIFSPFSSKKEKQQLQIIFVENNVSETLQKANQRIALSCIDCGICHRVCPVIQNLKLEIKPIDFIKDKNQTEKESIFQCTLCELCSMNCPAAIPIHKLIVNQREENINKKFVLSSERHKFASMKKQNLNRQQTNAPGLFKKNNIEQYYPHIKKEESQNFNKEWREKKQIK